MEQENGLTFAKRSGGSIRKARTNETGIDIPEAVDADKPKNAKSGRSMWRVVAKHGRSTNYGSGMFASGSIDLNGVELT